MIRASNKLLGNGRRLLLLGGSALAAVAAGLVLASVAGASGAAASCASGSCTVVYSVDGTTVQSWTPPAGVTSARFTVDGAAGGSVPDTSYVGGNGAAVTATIGSLTTSKPVSISVGGIGNENAASAADDAGYFGGGAGSVDGGGGGGYSEVTIAGTPELVAGGGGGGGDGGLGAEDVTGAIGGAGGETGSPGGTGGSTAGSDSGILYGGGGGGGGAATVGTAGAAGSFTGDSACVPGEFTSGTAGSAMQGGNAGVIDAGGGGGGWGGGGGGGNGGYENPAGTNGAAAGCNGWFAGGGGGGGGSSYANTGTSTPVSGAGYASGVDTGNGQVTITYSDPVVAQNQSYTLAYGQDLTLAAASGLLGSSGASGPAGDALTLTNTNPAHGTLTVNHDGSFSYVPAAGYVGSDSFTYTVTDAAGDYATGTVALTMQAAVTPPPALGGSAGPGAPAAPNAPAAPSAPAVSAPAVLSGPAVTGTPKAGSTLTCTPGDWSASPSFSYQWDRDGTPVAGATADSYRVAGEDEGTTLTCVVTATNSAGSQIATGNQLTIPVPKVKGCPAAKGSVTAAGIGPVHLGITESQAKHAFPGATPRTHSNQLYFCLTPTGIRVGFATTQAVSILPRHERAPYAGRVIWISTGSASYAIDRVRVGESVADAGTTAHLSKLFVVGLNDWYLATDGRDTAVYKSRRGVIDEIGIATKALTGTSRAEQRTFLTSFA